MKINVNDKMHTIIKSDEKLKEIFFELGFSDLVKPGMLQTVGRMVSLKDGSRLRKIDLEYIVEELKKKGYEVVDE